MYNLSSTRKNNNNKSFVLFQTKSRIGQYENQLETTIKKTQRKVETLKAQFHDHKNKWEQVGRVHFSYHLCDNTYMSIFLH